MWRTWGFSSPHVSLHTENVHQYFQHSESLGSWVRVLQLREREVKGSKEKVDQVSEPAEWDEKSQGLEHEIPIRTVCFQSSQGSPRGKSKPAEAGTTSCNVIFLYFPPPTPPKPEMPLASFDCVLRRKGRLIPSVALGETWVRAAIQETGTECD